jgi:hypothetical protein
MHFGITGCSNGSWIGWQKKGLNQLVTVTDEADLTQLATVERKLQGHA